VDATLPALLADVSARFAPREALVSPRGRTSYAGLGRQAEAIGRGLAALDVGKGTHVGLLLPNTPEWVAIAFGVWQCGGVLVPLNTLLRPRELGYALRHADVRVLVAARRFLGHDYEAAIAALVPGGAGGGSLRDPALPALRHVVWLDPPPAGRPYDCGPLLLGADAFPARVADALAEAVSPADPATIFFTSGTTADPKGVVHVHRAIARMADDVAAVLGLDADDRTWGALPFFFTGGLVAVGLATLACGGAVVVQERFEAGEALRLLEEERCTVFYAWPHQAEALLAHPDFARARLSLRKGVGANAKWAGRIYPPRHHAVGTYGMTETGPLCTAWPWDAPAARRAGSHGPPVRGREIRICDPETGAPRPIGEEGEICVRGPSLFATYYRREPADCVDAEGFFHTGDLGRLDAAGALEFRGRLKDVIKTAGVNVAAAEVEAALLAHPAVGSAHVVGVPHPTRGENVAAFVVLTGAATPDALLAHCRTQLASYKVPRHLWLEREDALPIKGSGKVDKAALRAEAARRAGALTADDDPSGPRRAGAG
jgi:acyl-CoA synthetase (AMP-forming)/AMP-acid ligase II